MRRFECKMEYYRHVSDEKKKTKHHRVESVLKAISKSKKTSPAQIAYRVNESWCFDKWGAPAYKPIRDIANELIDTGCITVEKQGVRVLYTVTDNGILYLEG